MFSRFVLLVLLSLSGVAWGSGHRIDFHFAYGDKENILIEGRMIKDRNLREISKDDGRLRNLKRSLKRFFNDEAEEKCIFFKFGENSQEEKGVFALTDEEGYFRLEIKTPDALDLGWNKVFASSGSTTSEGRILVVPPDNTVGLISDLDDTILVSNVLSKRRLLSNTFLKNPLQRQAFDGAAKTYQQLTLKNPVPASSPIFYLSASPRQIQAEIKTFLMNNHFPEGVVVTKRISNDQASEPLLDQFSYKTAKITEVFERLPHVRFILAGDDGEKDPEIYHQIRAIYPDRVIAIWIRNVSSQKERKKYDDQEIFPD